MSTYEFIRQSRIASLGLHKGPMLRIFIYSQFCNILRTEIIAINCLSQSIKKERVVKCAIYADTKHSPVCKSRPTWQTQPAEFIEKDKIDTLSRRLLRSLHQIPGRTQYILYYSNTNSSTLLSQLPLTEYI